MNILAVNAGSSTLKMRLYALDGPIAGNGAANETLLADGSVDRIGTGEALLRVTQQGQPEESRPMSAVSPAEAMEQAIQVLTASDESRSGDTLAVDAIGYRVVHGGQTFTEATRITPETLEQLRALNPLAPLHNPVDVSVIEAGLRLLPQTPAVAVFDTAFHHDLPAVTARYALPQDLCEKYQIRRYGFHGISYRYVSGLLLEKMGRTPQGTRLILCHLGSGASVCALRDGRSVDTSMGMTPLEGLVMGTRSGDLDPGLLLYLLKESGMTPDAAEEMLNRRCGLLALSERSADMRDLEKAAEQGDDRAELALESFAYRVRKYIGAYAAALGGLDAVGFTGGIGEHSAAMRTRICRGLDFLGLTLDDARNVAAGKEPACISEEGRPAQIWMLPTDEARQIVRETYALLQAARNK